jgi:hypothetical protein
MVIFHSYVSLPEGKWRFENEKGLEGRPFHIYWHGLIEMMFLFPFLGWEWSLSSWRWVRIDFRSWWLSLFWGSPIDSEGLVSSGFTGCLNTFTIKTPQIHWYLKKLKLPYLAVETPIFRQTPLLISSAISHTNIHIISPLLMVNLYYPQSVFFPVAIDLTIL